MTLYNHVSLLINRGGWDYRGALFITSGGQLDLLGSTTKQEKNIK